MALVVLLKGVNVGGRRSFRPAEFVKQLHHFDAVNIGATGAFVIRRRVNRTQLRAEIARMLPFDAEVMICHGHEIAGLLDHAAVARCRAHPEIVRFVSVLSRVPRSAPLLPIALPSSRAWLLKIIAREGRFVLGLYRRHMKVIGYMAGLDRVFGVPATTRNWNTIAAIARALDVGPTRGGVRRRHQAIQA